MAPDAPDPSALESQPWGREAFVEEMGLLWEAAGSGRMDGRIIAYLLITDVPYVSSGQLAKALRVSAGSISLATRRLTEAGFLKRHAVPGERSRYFRVDDDVWGSFLAGERRYLAQQRLLAERALELLSPGEEAPRRRLQNMRDYMRWLQGSHRDLLARWKEYRSLSSDLDEEKGERSGPQSTEGGSPSPELPPEDTGGRSFSVLSPLLTQRLVPDALWVAVEPLLPPGRAGDRAARSGAVRDERTAFTAVVYVLTSGCGWQQLPPHFGISSATAHRRFTSWSKAGVWQRWLDAVTAASASRLDEAPDEAWCTQIVKAAENRGPA